MEARAVGRYIRISPQKARLIPLNYLLISLAGLSSHHARRLKKSTEEFCDNLKQLEEGEPIGYARVDDTLLGSYIVWYVVEKNHPLGCLYVIGKSEVSEEEWASIWNE